MARLEIHLLGPFTVTKDGQPVVFAYDKVRALLAYLVVETGHSASGGYSSPISRPRLAGLLWPDQPQNAAQDSLRQALSRLRSLIDDRNTLSPFLQIGRDSIQIKRGSSVQIDLDVFEDALGRVAAHHHRSFAACTTCAALLKKADQLLLGDFLEDLSLPDSDLFENWVTTQRERIRIQALGLFSGLAQYYERRSEPECSLAYATRQINLDPYHEPAHRQMMLALVRSGQRSQAVLHFHRLKQLLEDDLGILPTDETLALFETIRQGNDLPIQVSAQVNNLPMPLTPLVGRVVELSELAVWLSDPDRRLISIVGPGGVGKTLLAIEAVRQAVGMFAGGAVYVPLIRSDRETKGTALGDAIAGALGLTGMKDPWPQVLEACRKQEMLLVLDGFEHALAERERVAQLLEANAGLVILTTTRQHLDLAGEWIFGLGGLDIPPLNMDNQLEAYSAVSLFCYFARQVNQSFVLNDANRSSIGEICRFVEGLPLAIRLAAAWTRSLPCPDIAVEIRRSLDILTSRNGPRKDDRQSSVRAVFEQSWNQLAPTDREIFSRLSIFHGGFERAAAEAVCGATAEALARMVDQSLLRMSNEGRYDMHDLLSQFGAEKIKQSGEEEAIHRRHFDWYCAKAEQNEQALHGDGSLNAFIWLIREAPNLREALVWGQANDSENAARLASWMHSDFHQTGLHVFVQQNRTL